MRHDGGTRSWLGLWCTSAAVAVACVSLSGNPEPCPDPFAFFGSAVTVGARERARLDAGEALVRILPGEGREIAVFSAVTVGFDAERLLAWMARIEELKKSDHVPAVGRFSEPPQLSDLAHHVLDDKDLDRLRDCRPGDCGLKLSAAEIARVRRDWPAGPEWKRDAQVLFRQILLDRVLAYRAGGHAAIETYADGHTDRSLPEVARFLMDRSPYLTERLPAVVPYFTDYPRVGLPGSDDYLYWSTDPFGGRPVTSASHVAMLRPTDPHLPEAAIVSRQLFATHYQNGSLSLTLLLRGCTDGKRYLAYVSRSEVDVIRGVMGWLARRIIQGRVEDDAAEVLRALRDRLSKSPGTR